MKKLFAPITLIALAGVVFSSCSNSSKLAFTKRHYRSGYFVDLVKKARTSANNSVARITLKPEKQISIPTIATPEKSIATNRTIIASATPAIIQKITVPKKMDVSKSTGIYWAPISSSVVSFDKATSNDVAGSSGGDHGGRDNVSVPFVVIVLCAIFIPPLGVGLMYGLNSYFWIDLILTLLFFFPGMIFALIVVLM